MTTGNALTIRNLSRWFGNRPGMRKLSLDVHSGDTIGVVGPNGAGKTTFLKLLAGHLPPTTGTVRFDDAVTVPGPAYNRAFGYAGHELMLYDQLTPQENLQFFSDLYGLPDGGDRISELLDQMNLLERQSSRIKQFSNGMKRKLSLCRAVLHKPDLLLLDEPFQGIDASSVRRIHELLTSFLDRGGTLVLSTHDLSRVQQFCTRMLMLVDTEPKWCREVEGWPRDELQRLYREALGSDERSNASAASGVS